MNIERATWGMCTRASIAAHDAQIDWHVYRFTIEFA
jgi:DNA-binding transcriptional regulator YdaS (Cro superfamily)